MSRAVIPEEFADTLVSATRTAVGEELRSVTYFTPDEAEQLYLRSDLEAEADLVGFTENERLGFRSQVVYDSSELGEYRYTIRVFEYGYLTRVIVGGHGAFVTTDEMAMDRFDELASAVRAVLADHDSQASGGD